MNEDSVTEQPAEANVSSAPPRHDLENYAAGGLRGRPGFDPDALHSARSRIKGQAAARAAEVESGGNVRVRRSAP
jgi:hypothetical protein